VVLFGMAASASGEEMVPYGKRWDIEFHSCPPERVLEKLDLSGEDLEDAREAAERGDRLDALRVLREYYRRRYPLPEMPERASRENLAVADQLTRHVFQWGPYEAADYGEDIDWAWDPRGDIEWVAAVYRFYWATTLSRAYAETRDEKYARAFVELTADWIARHPLEDWRRVHPVYTRWKGYPWLDLQTGIRATNLCSAFKTTVHADSFTPEFLGVLLASLYDHQVKTATVPMGIVHNKAIFEQRGFVAVADTFPEFRESRDWLELGLARSRENMLAQTTTDGVQREWAGSYHLAVLRDAVEIMKPVERAGVPIPADYRERVRFMYDYLFAIATPDLGFPMFGDCARPLTEGRRRSQWYLYRALVEASDLFDDPKYAARATLDREHLPARLSYAFPEAGIYAMRSEWGPQQIYMALHCAPPAISGHDQPDNGTFELYGYGRWLMNDTGFFTYGHDRDARDWHRQTRVHQTLTLDDKDSRVAGKQLLWNSGPDGDVLVVENESYPGLVHRRTVWFVDRSFFVLLDEALGTASGRLDLHFQFAPGSVRVKADKKSAETEFADANVLVQAAAGVPVALEKEKEGWFAWEYGSRTERTAIRIGHEREASAGFLTLVVPFKGRDLPEVECRWPESWEIGEPAVTIDVSAFGRSWRIGRDLRTRTAWCRAR
jgi:heparan-sulfate lyase